MPFVVSSSFLRDDIFWLLPAVAIALFQVKVVWKKLPTFNSNDTEIPGAYKEDDQLRISFFIYSTYFLLFLQLVFTLFPITTPSIPLLRIGGYLLVSLGAFTSLSALKHLKENWTSMTEYRIKKEQTLTTCGPFAYIRHPIYASAIIEVAGFELIANSLLLIPFFIAGLIIMYKHSLLEEDLLENKFGEEFVRYKKKTKMFFPFLF